MDVHARESGSPMRSSLWFPPYESRGRRILSDRPSRKAQIFSERHGSTQPESVPAAPASVMEARTAFTDEQYANPYPPGIERSYWHRARNRILLRRLAPVLAPRARILDIGCGPGIVVDHLRREGLDCAGVDLGTP